MAAGNLTIIVGAGASVELGFPAGRGLLSEISKKVNKIAKNGHQTYYTTASKNLERSLEKIAANGDSKYSHAELIRVMSEAYWIASNAPLAPSIDNLLHSHQSDSTINQVGKALICDCLYDAERQSAIMPYTSRPDDISYLHRTDRNLSAANSWLSRMFWLLAEGSQFKDYLEKLSKINFICFNYDRCIEHYLSNAAISYFKLESNDTAKALNSIRIVHPYGSLGKLQVKGGWVTGFGECDDLYESSLQIKTFTEGLQHESHKESISQGVKNADRIVFLGFGFLPLNMDLLFNGIDEAKLPRILGTAKGLSNSSAEIIKDFILGYPAFSKQAVLHQPKNRISLQDLTCCEFMDFNSFEFRR